MDKTLENLKETLEDEIKKITKKGDITPAELESIQKAVCTIDMIKNMTEGESEGMMRDSSYGYSGRNYSRGRTSYDGSYGDYSNNSYRRSRGSYGDSYGDYSERMYYDSYGNEGGSYRRGRSPVTGRYISRGMDDYSGRGRSYNDGYSGHSIIDRMVARLESMMDEAQTEHERQTVSEWINRLSNQ